MQYIKNLYLVNFCKFVISKSSWKNEVDIKSVYIMSSEFRPGYVKPMQKILIVGGLNKRGFVFQVEITNWGVVIVWNG